MTPDLKRELFRHLLATLVYRADVAISDAPENFAVFKIGDTPLKQPVEKVMQGPISDALTHVGQIVMLRRAAGASVRVEGYFAAEIVAGEIEKEFSRTNNDN